MTKFLQGYAPRMSLRGWSHSSHQQIQDGCGGHQKCPPPERIHASERLLSTRPTFSETVMVFVGVSKLGCTELGENKRCLLPRCAADTEAIVSR